MIAETFLQLPLVAGAFAAGAVLAWYFERGRGRDDRAAREKVAKMLETQLAESRLQYDQARTELDRLRTEAAGQQAAIARLEERNASAQETLQQLRASLPETFKSLAGEILHEKAQLFAAENQTALSQILNPLRDKIGDFQNKIDTFHTQQVQDRTALGEQVKNLVAANQRITEEANHLASALKGSSKTQGNWGEQILVRILEIAGLRQGYEYEVQESFTAADGKRSQPDVLIRLTGGRHLVIDSKVSLVHYELHVHATDGGVRDTALQAHVNSVRTHIKGLSEKNYQNLPGLNSPDFVILFVPIEPAFMLAISSDDKLWEQAWQRNILLVSPSTLLFVLRTVAYLWRQEQQERNAQEIANRGAVLYNKLAAFVEDLQDVGNNLTRARTSYDEAFKKLSTGNGNAIRQAEMLKSLGVKPRQQLPADLIGMALEERDELPAIAVEETRAEGNLQRNSA